MMKFELFACRRFRCFENNDIADKTGVPINSILVFKYWYKYFLFFILLKLKTLTNK